LTANGASVSSIAAACNLHRIFTSGKVRLHREAKRCFTGSTNAGWMQKVTRDKNREEAVMNYQKMAPQLASALRDVSSALPDHLTVFVQTKAAPTAEQAETLRTLGVRVPEEDRTIFTADLSTATISQLTDLPWIKLIRASQQLRPLAKEE